MFISKVINFLLFLIKNNKKKDLDIMTQLIFARVFSNFNTKRPFKRLPSSLRNIHPLHERTSSISQSTLFLYDLLQT